MARGVRHCWEDAAAFSCPHSCSLLSLGGHKGFLTVWFPSLTLFKIFFSPFFPLGVERWLGVYFRRWEGDRFCNNKPAFLPAARDEWLWNLQTWLPTSAEKEAAWIEGKRFISFRLGGSANFPGAERRGVKRTGLRSQAHGQTPSFFLPFCLFFFPPFFFFFSWLFFSTSYCSRIRSLQKFIWTIVSQTECGFLVFFKLFLFLLGNFIFFLFSFFVLFCFISPPKVSFSEIQAGQNGGTELWSLQAGQSLWCRLGAFPPYWKEASDWGPLSEGVGCVIPPVLFYCVLILFFKLFLFSFFWELFEIPRPCTSVHLPVRSPARSSQSSASSRQFPTRLNSIKKICTINSWNSH